MGAGVLFFLIQKDILIITWSTKIHTTHLEKTAISRKKVKLFFWNDEKFQSEEVVLAWEKNLPDKNLQNLINNWLSLVQDEKLINEKVRLELVAISPLSHEVIIAFNRPILAKGWPIIKKWHLLESLCRTIRETELSISFIVFLVNDAIMKDDHLDFSQPWPIDGFLENNT